MILLLLMSTLKPQTTDESLILSHNNNTFSPSLCFLALILPPVFTNSERTCDKDFIIRRAATNRVLNVLRHWVSKHSQVCLHPPPSVCVCVCVGTPVSAGAIKSVVSLKQGSDAFALCSTALTRACKQPYAHKHTPNVVAMSIGRAAQPASVHLPPLLLNS